MRHDQLPTELLKPASVIARSADRMERIIADLLDFARGRFGQGIPISPQAASMEAICRRVVDELALANPARELRMSVEGDTSGIWDPARIAQVVSNLVGNAITHGVGPVEVALRGDRESVRLTVCNQGTPIAPEALPQLFQPFFARASRGHGNGLGLGLFIASEIVKAHKGRISVTSSHAEGTIFTVELPKSGR
jgi:signal transduction histidine kinase